MSVALIASYLAFFPVSIGALRGLKSPDTNHVELMRSYGVGWWTTLLRLRLPASVPYLLPALRLGAASAVIGTVVAEVSIGLRGGIGRMIVEFAAAAGGDPAKPWAPIFGAVARRPRRRGLRQSHRRVPAPLPPWRGSSMSQSVPEAAAARQRHPTPSQSPASRASSPGVAASRRSRRSTASTSRSRRASSCR